jgi:hypothetical protein
MKALERSLDATVLVALIMLGTAATRSCPVYSVLGMNTCPRNAGP